MTENRDVGLTPAMMQSLEMMQSFTDGELPLTHFYAQVDLFEERISKLDPSTLDARVLAPIAASLGGVCIMSRAGETLEDVIDYVRERRLELANAGWRARVASGWWPYGSDESSSP